MNDSKILFFSTDLDGTLLGDRSSERRFKSSWESLPEARPVLCYNTGRMREDVEQLIERGRLPAPDFIISGVGTQVFDQREKRVLRAFSELLDEGWDLDQVESIVRGHADAITRQPDHYQHAHKSSWYYSEAPSSEIQRLEEALEAAGLEVHVIYSSALHLDVLPKWANKGNALRWLLRHLGIAARNTLVAGDSGNDSAMYELEGVQGIIVGNAQPELVEVAQSGLFFKAPPHEICANAVMSGLMYYQIIGAERASEELGI